MKIFALSPAQSWALIGCLVVLCFLVTFLIYCIDRIVGLAIWNYRIDGIKGIGYALLGVELYEILRESVIEVSRRSGGYVVTTTDSERNYEYVVTTTRTDKGNPEYDEAIKIAGENASLKNKLLPDSRVKKFFTLKDKETGAKADCFVVYCKYDNIKFVEDALNKFFENEFYEAIRETRKYA